jgi:hypothetical protein
MARLPSMGFIIQLIGPDIVLFEDGSEEEVVRYPAGDGNAAAIAQGVVHRHPGMSEEDKCFAHFWCGYFWAHREGSSGMIPVRVEATARPVLASERVFTLAQDHPMAGVSCPACDEPLGNGTEAVLVLAGIAPQDRKPAGWSTGGAIAVHKACATGEVGNEG